MPHAQPAARERRSGLLQGIGAYLLWGFMPLYFPLLAPTGPVEIIAHRVVWSLLLCLALLAATGTLGSLRTVARTPRTLWLLALAGLLVGTNWLVFVLGVLTGHTVDAAIGYYINPLVTVALAVLGLGERLRPLQWAALGIGASAVVVLTVGVGRLPWIALVLAGTFSVYGLIKNRVGRSVPALTSLAVETAWLSPLALTFLLVLGAQGTGTFGAHGGWHTAGLVGAGLITTVPLLLFGAAARRLPLSVVGMLQYLTPTMQFVVGVAIFGEPMPAVRWWGVGLIWVALLVLGWDGVRASGRARSGQPVTLNR